MSALPQVEETTDPAYRVPDTGYLPDEGQFVKVWIGIAVGIPTAAVVGAALTWMALAGTGAEYKAASYLLAIPFGGMFGFLGGAIGGLMATVRSH